MKTSLIQTSDSKRSEVLWTKPHNQLYWQGVQVVGCDTRIVQPVTLDVGQAGEERESEDESQSVKASSSTHTHFEPHPILQQC